MKKAFALILSLVLAFTMVLSLVACSKDEDTTETQLVTDENGEPVTDEDGNNVYVVIEEPIEDDDTTAPDQTQDDKDQTTDSSDKTSAKDNSSGKTTAKKTTSKKTTAKKTTAKKTTEKKTTKPTTTTKAKLRKVTLSVYLPYYNNEKHDMIVWYKLLDEETKDGKKPEWKKLDPIEVLLDDSTVKVDMGKLKGRVKVVVKFKDKNMTDKLQSGCNAITIESNKAYGKITLVTGIEQIDAGMD